MLLSVIFIRCRFAVGAVRRMQLELEIFRQLQMKRKEAPRPSDSSDNSAASGAVRRAACIPGGGARGVMGGVSGSMSGGVSGVVSTCSGGGPKSSSSVGSPSSSPTDQSSSTDHRSSTANLREPGGSDACHTGDLPQSQAARASSVVKSQTGAHTARGEPATGVQHTGHLPPTTPAAAAAAAAAQFTGQSTAVVHRPLTQCSSQPAVSLSSHRGASRPATRPLAKPPRPPRPLSYSGGTAEMKLSQTVSSQCDSDMLNTAQTSSQLLTLSQGVSSQSADTDTDTSSAAAVLSKPATLSQVADSSADSIQLEALSHDAAVSALCHTDVSDGNVTEL